MVEFFFYFGSWNCIHRKWQIINSTRTLSIAKEWWIQDAKTSKFWPFTWKSLTILSTELWMRLWQWHIMERITLEIISGKWLDRTARYGMENLSQMLRALSVYNHYHETRCCVVLCCVVLVCTDNIWTFMRMPNINPFGNSVFCEGSKWKFYAYMCERLFVSFYIKLEIVNKTHTQCSNHT